MNKLKDPVTPADFGIPEEHSEKAEYYSNLRNVQLLSEIDRLKTLEQNLKQELAALKSLLVDSDLVTTWYRWVPTRDTAGGIWGFNHIEKGLSLKETPEDFYSRGWKNAKWLAAHGYLVLGTDSNGDCKSVYLLPPLESAKVKTDPEEALTKLVQLTEELGLY